MRSAKLTLAFIAALGLVACSNDEGATAPEAETTLVSVAPAAGATGVDPKGSITIRFSGPMASGMEQYVDIHQFDIRGPIVSLTHIWSADRTTLTCTPSAPLHQGTRYTVHLGSGMRDARGHHADVDDPGGRMGGHPVTSQTMNDHHGSHPTGMMGSGWQHPEWGHLGMAFTFQTRTGG
jgi:hypothetical protein